MAPMKTPNGRLNAHVHFSDHTSDQTLHDFKAALRVAIINRPLSNAALAVVRDAEQVIWSVFGRTNGSKISYVAGAIENPAINGHVVNVLEGTMPAFNNRRIKYHPAAR